MRQVSVGIDPREHWTQLALCREHPDPDSLWFAADREGQERAVAICQECPVKDRCLREAVAWASQVRTGLAGVWAGRYPSVIRRLDRERRKAATGGEAG